MTSASSSASPPPSPSGTGRPEAGAGLGAILLFLCLGQFMVFLDVSIVNLALPSIREALDMSEVDQEYIVTAYATVLGGFLLLGGRLGDRFGRLRMLQAGFVVFALASLAAGLAVNGAMLITARGVQGLGSALIAPSALALLTSSFPAGPQRNKALGVWGSLAGIASIVGVILGGLLADGPGWEWIFYLNVPVGLTAALVAPRIVPDGRTAAPKHRRSFDTFGALTLTSGLLLLIFTLGEATRIGWTSGRTLGGLAGAALLLAVFVVTESRAAEPIVPLGFVRKKTMRTANIAAVLVFGTFAALFFFASIFMQQVYGYSPLKAGFAYLPLAVAVAAGAVVASGLLAKLAARTVLMGGLVLAVVGLLLMWRAPAGGSYAADLLTPFVLLGLGCGMVYVTLQIAAFTGLSAEEAGTGAGLINTSQEAGGALGLAVITSIAYNGLSGDLAAAGGDPARIAAAQEAANHDAFLAAAVGGLAALVTVALLMPRGRKTPGTEGVPPEAGAPDRATMPV